MNYQIRDSDIALLRKAGVPEDDIKHCTKVAEKAIEIGQRTGLKLDMELVGRGALFHDLGKAVTHAIEHGKIGAEMGKDLGLPEAITAHYGKTYQRRAYRGRSKGAWSAGKRLCLKEFEERIVIYADRLVDIITDGIVDIKGDETQAEQRFEEILKEYPKYGKNFKTLQRYLGYHQEIQGLIKKQNKVRQLGTG